MKKHILFWLLLAGMALTSCTDKIDLEIAALREQITDIESQLAKFNSTLNSLSELVAALEKNDHIKSITPYGSDAYRVSFTSGNVLLLQNGKNGVTPIVGIQYNEALGNYYWTIQMGPDGVVTWMTNSYGQRVRATGIVPTLKIEDGVWMYSFDGVNWTRCPWGESQGKEGTAVFENIDTTDPYYVVFTLTNGTVFKLPTQKGFDELTALCKQMNEEFETYTQLVNDLDGKMFVKSIAEWQENGQHVGYIVTMEDGSKLQIRDGKDYNFTTQISARQDTDGKYYWIYRTNPKEPYQWLYYKGNKVPVTPDDVTPRIGITEVNGELFFTIGYEGGEPELMIGTDGKPVQASGRAGFSLLRGAAVSAGCLKLMLDDGKVITLGTQRLFIPSLTLTQSVTGVAKDTYYETVLQATVVDTLQFMATMPDYDTYKSQTHTDVTAVAVDGGYSGQPKLVSFTTKGTSSGTEYTIVLNIPFRTAADAWDTSHKSRVAVFLTWDSNTVMKVATFDNL